MDSTFEDTVGTLEPTSSGTACTTAIATNATCYENGDDIRISFQNCDAEAFDWIGVYPASTEISNLRGAIAWMWTCGDQLCTETVSAGDVTFFNAEGFGTFRIYLLRDDGINTGGPFIPIGIGNEFIMSTECDS
jgi:hypothetical protein